MDKKEELLSEIREEIKKLNERLNVGIQIINDCRRQRKVLKAKLKEYEILERKVSSHAADGNL